MAVAMMGLIPVSAPSSGAVYTGPPAAPAAVRSSPQAACNVLVTAHRGTGSGTRSIGGHTFSENTIPAFIKALTEGADGFEADYWPTADGRIATHHDDTLDRMTDASGRIGRANWAQIASVRHPSGATIPSFEAVEMAMRAYGGYRQQEVKQGALFSDQLLRHMIELDVEHVPGAYDRVLYTSSEMRTLRRIHTIDPRIRLGLVARTNNGRPTIAGLPEWLDVVLIDLRAADAAFVRQAADTGYEVSVRGVDTVAQLRQVAAIGATRVVTNRPDVLGRAC